MTKVKKSTATRENKTIGSSYGLRRKLALNTTKQNNSKSKLTVKKTKLTVKKAADVTSKPVTRRLNGIIKNNLIKGSPIKKLTVPSSKIRLQRTKQLTDAARKTSEPAIETKEVSTINKIESESHVEEVIRIQKSVINESKGIIKRRRGRPAKKLTGASTEKAKQIAQKTPIIKNGRKTSEPAIETKEVTANKTPSKIVTLGIPKRPTVRLERLSKKLVNFYTVKNKANSDDNKIIDVNSTPQNKDVSIRNKSVKPTRVLRKRNHKISNKYKDCSLNSPLIIRKPSIPNPLAVYEFEFDPSDEPAKKQNRKKKYESESSGDDDNEMKYILKKLRKANKKVAIKNNKKVSKKQKNYEKQKKAEQVNEEPKKVEKKQTESTTVTLPEKQEKPTEVAEKQLLAPEKQTVAEKQLPTPEKQEIPEIIHEIPQISVNSVEMMSISDSSDPLDSFSPIDPSIQARCIVDEVTKSFIEDLSDEEPNCPSPGKLKILSNVVLRKPKTYKNKNKIFNSTTIGLKPSRPWRIDVSAIRRIPPIFTYKDKSFTPRYEPEIVPVNVCNISNPKEKQTDKNQENIKPTFQTSILDFVKSTKPKIIENKISGLFNDVPQRPVQSPRKVLGEINFVQSTPLKPINNNILKSPNISVIKPKNKSTDGMFGFSYFSDDDENKENVRISPRKSPKKLKPKPANPVVEIFKATVPIINTNKDKVLKEENVTVSEPDISTVPVDSDLSVALFQDNEIEVLKKSTRKYVRKQPKRKRLPSVDTIQSEDESEPEETEKKRKKKNKNAQTKEEEQEADRLAAHYNSMFEEMSKYPLLIE